MPDEKKLKVPSLQEILGYENNERAPSLIFEKQKIYARGYGLIPFFVAGAIGITSLGIWAISSIGRTGGTTSSVSYEEPKIEKRVYFDKTYEGDIREVTELTIPKDYNGVINTGVYLDQFNSARVYSNYGVKNAYEGTKQWHKWVASSNYGQAGKEWWVSNSHGEELKLMVCDGQNITGDNIEIRIIK